MKRFRDDSGLLRSGFLLMFANLLGAACNAGFHMVAGRALSPAEYAILAAMLGVVLATSTPMMAVQNTIAHYVARFVQAGNAGRTSSFYRGWALSFLGIALLLAAAGFLLRAPLATLWPGASRSLVALTAAVMGFSLLMPVGYGLLQGLQAFRALAWIPQAWGSTRFLLAAALLPFLPTAFAALSAQAAGVLATLFLLLFFGSRLAASQAPAGGALHKPPEGARLQSVLPYALASLLALSAYAVLAYLDITLARHLFPGDPSTDLFAKAATIARTAVFLPQPLALALFPKVASDGSLPPGTTRLLVRATVVSALLALAALAGCCLLPWLPWAILYGPAAPETAPLAFSFVRLMALALCPLAIAYPLLQFALAQRQYAAVPAVLLPAALYLGALFLLQRDVYFQLTYAPLQIPFFLLAANLLSCLALATLVFLRARRSGSGGAASCRAGGVGAEPPSLGDPPASPPSP